MPPLSGKQRKAQLKLKRAIKRGEAPQPLEQPRHRPRRTPRARPAAGQPARNPRSLQSQFVRLDKRFLDDTRAFASSVVLRRPIQSGVVVLGHEWIAPPKSQLAPRVVPRRPKWRYQMSKDELDANEQAYFRAWLAQQDAIVEQWQHAVNSPASTDQTHPSTDLASDPVDDSETYPTPCPPTHFERNIEVWRQFWRVTEISQILLVLLDSRCPPLHLPASLSAYLNIPTSSLQSDPSPYSRSSKSKAPHIILVLTKVDISGPARTASWTSFLSANHPGVPVVPVEAYTSKSSLTVEQGPNRYEPHLPDGFRERLVHTLRDVHEQLLQPPQWITTPRPEESEESRLERIHQWRPRVKRVIDWDGLLQAKGKMVGKAVGGAAVPKGQVVDDELEGTAVYKEDGLDNSESEAEGTGDADEPEFLTVGVVGQPNVGKSSLLNAIFGATRVRASRTPGKTKHFQTLFWTSDVRLVDCPGLVVPSFVPMDIQVLSGVLPISRISAVPFCVHQLARLLPLERILKLTHPSLPTPTVASTSGHDLAPQDRRTWRPGQRPLEHNKGGSEVPQWTANDIMTAYAEKKGWVTAKAGRPDIHRAGNAILRLVAEGKIPWGFWPPGSSVSGDEGVWLKDGAQQHEWDELRTGQDRDDSEASGTEELLSDEEDTKARVVVASNEPDESEEGDESEDESLFRGGNFGRFGALEIDSE